VLRVNRGATRDEIKAAYRREIAQYHPDKVAQLGSELRELATRRVNRLTKPIARSWVDTFDVLCAISV
jgi:DnaJ-class molecular chaperone